MSVTIGHIRCGTSLNWLISTIFGSTRISFTWSGRLVMRMLAMIELMHTLLPEPVVPAISMCGMDVRSAIRAAPDTSLPRNSGRPIFSALGPATAISSFSRTISLSRFGTSMPMVFLPGSGATTRTDGAFSARAMSLARAATCDTLLPGASCSSNIVMTGPVSISTTRASSRNSSSVCSSTLPLARTWASCWAVNAYSGSPSSESGGKTQSSSWRGYASLGAAGLRSSMIRTMGSFGGSGSGDAGLALASGSARGAGTGLVAGAASSSGRPSSMTGMPNNLPCFASAESLPGFGRGRCTLMRGSAVGSPRNARGSSGCGGAALASAGAGANRGAAADAAARAAATASPDA